MFWWILATLCAFFVKGLCGFANTLVFTTILSFGNNNANISPVELLLGYPTNAIMVWKERKAINWRICLPLAALVVLGSIPGILFLKNADTGLIKILFGIVIVVLGLEMLWREQRDRRQEMKFERENRFPIGLTIIGVLSGILCGLYGVGALLGAYVSRVTKDSHSFKGNLCVVFLVENTLRVVLYTVWGIITPDIVKQALILVPVMLAGLVLGILSGKVLDEKVVKKIVILMLIVSGVALVINCL